MNPSALPQHFLRSAVLLGASLLGGCSGSETPAEDVRVFCDGIRVGEPFADVEARYSEFRIQAGGFARDPGERLGGRLPSQERQKVTGILVEPSGSWSGERAVCAIYYSDPFLEGNGKVVLAEFKAVWAHRY
jgi:hypothetical protein